jgi:hypothetical protein
MDLTDIQVSLLKFRASIYTPSLVRGTSRWDGQIFWGHTKASVQVWLNAKRFEVKQNQNATRNQIARKKHAQFRILNPKPQKLTLDEVAKRERERSAKRRADPIYILKRKVYNKQRRQNPELKEKLKRYYSNYYRSYYQKNPEIRRAKKAARRAAQRDAVTQTFDRQKVRQIYAWKNRVQQCLGIRFDVDHIVPLSAGGEHSHRNLQVLPHRLNIAKGKNLDFRLPECWKQTEHGVRL